MKIVCDELPDKDGNRRIIAAIPDYRWYWFRMPTGNASYVVVDVPETEPNKTLCHDLLRKVGKEDIANKCKYYVDAADVVKEKPGWEERPPPDLHQDALGGAAEK